ncbi:MAG: tetratricopeptide repeat protein [Acidimicrobiales bacterium]
MPLHEARAAAQRGDHRTAHRLLAEADQGGTLDYDDLVLRAEVAYAIGELPTTFEAFERAHTLAADQGDHARAASAAGRISMHLMMDTGLMAAVRAWAKRAELHIDDNAVPMPAWLGVARAYERLLSGDFAAAREWGGRAVDAGRASGEPAPLAMGRVVQARSVIFEGDVDRGLELLDEAAAYALSGEVDPLPVGLIYCELICAWQALALFDRAEEYTRAMEHWCQRHAALGSVHGRCRVHRAELLRLRGSREAEEEAIRACDELSPILAREFGWPLNELGTIRLQTGDLDGAEEAFLRSHEAGWEPQPGLAYLHLERGEVRQAADSIAAALERPLDMPSKELPPNTELRRAPLLAAQVRISVEEGDLERARAAADELGAVAGRFSNRGLTAHSDHCNGLVALETGDLEVACRYLERAVQTWSDLQVPFESATARLGLARARKANGDSAGATMELRAAAATFDRIGATRRAAEIADTLGSPAGQGQPPAPRAASDATCRPVGDHWTITFNDHTVHIRDLKGLEYLQHLLARPGVEVHALELVDACRAAPPEPHPSDRDVSTSPEGDLGPVLDRKAKEQYRRRLLEIEEDLERAREMGDDGLAARAEVDREFLVRELSRAVGLGGRDRRVGGDAERARVSVTRALRLTLARIAEHHPVLGTHLDHAIRTGTYCSYSPDPQAPVEWHT